MTAAERMGATCGRCGSTNDVAIVSAAHRLSRAVRDRVETHARLGARHGLGYDTWPVEAQAEWGAVLNACTAAEHELYAACGIDPWAFLHSVCPVAEPATEHAEVSP